MPCIKTVYSDKRASTLWSAAMNKERFSSRGSTAYKPFVNRRFCSGIRFTWDFACSCFQGVTQETFLRCLGEYGTLDPWAICFVSVPYCPAPPRRTTVHPDPTRPWYVRVLDSTSRASRETFRRCVFDALEGTRDACPLNELFCCCPVLPDPAPPLRCAPRPDLPVVCSRFGFDKCCP